MVQMGSYKELMGSSSTFARLLEDVDQHEQISRSLSQQQSVVESIISEKDTGDDPTSGPVNVEVQLEGNIRWHVYFSYLRAGVGVILGCCLIIGMFSAYEIISIGSGWWLVSWSNDESRRYLNRTSCLSVNATSMDPLKLMSETEWNAHRNQRFYVFAGQSHDRDGLSSGMNLVLALVGALFCLTCLRSFACVSIFLNAARVLHDKCVHSRWNHLRFSFSSQNVQTRHPSANLLFRHQSTR